MQISGYFFGFRPVSRNREKREEKANEEEEFQAPKRAIEHKESYRRDATRRTTGPRMNRARFAPRTIKTTSGLSFSELAPGTKVWLDDRSGGQNPKPLVGYIVSLNMNGKCGDTGTTLPTYMVRLQEGGVNEIACEDVHDARGGWHIADISFRM